MAIDGIYAGYVLIVDELKEDSRKTMIELRKWVLISLSCLRGQQEDKRGIATRLELDEVYSELLPDQKVEKLETLYKQKSSKGKLIFVGDGINDAPVLARADVELQWGIGRCSYRAADVVIMTDEPSKLVTAIRIAKKTRSIVWQNIVFAMLVKVIIVRFWAPGISTMWEAVLPMWEWRWRLSTQCAPCAFKPQTTLTSSLISTGLPAEFPIKMLLVF